MTQVQYSVKSITDMPQERKFQLANEANFAVDVTMETGEVIHTDFRRLLLSSMYWPILQRAGVPVGREGWVGNRRWKSGSHIAYLNRLIWYTYDQIKLTRFGEGVPDLDEMEEEMVSLCDTALKVASDICNDVNEYLSGFGVTLDLLDYMEVMADPVIREVLKDMPSTMDGFEDAYDKTLKRLKAPGINSTAIARTVNNATCKSMQCMQVMIARGFLTDADSVIFSQVPIPSGYLMGVHGLLRQLVDSRSAYKSLINQEKPLQDTQYFNKRMQLICQYVQEKRNGDCGSTKTTTIYIKDRTVLSAVLGMNRVAGGVTSPIQPTDTGLIGTWIETRNPLLCNHRHEGAVCSTCLGQVSESFLGGSNLGHFCVSVLCAIISQLVLSIKHYDGSSVVDIMNISDWRKNYIVAGEDGNSIFLHSDLDLANTSLVVNQLTTTNIGDIARVDDVTELKAEGLSTVPFIGLRITDPETGTQVGEVLNVTVHSRIPSLTYALLDHMKNHGWTVENEKNLIVPLENWNPELPILTLPMRHRNMSDYMKSVSVFIESKGDESTSKMKPAALRGVRKSRTRKPVESKVLSDFTDPSEALAAFYSIVASKVSINMAHLSVVMLSMSRGQYDYNVPHPDQPLQFDKQSVIMAGRSQATMLGYQNIPKVTKDIRSYMDTNRMRHPLDSLQTGV